MIRLRYSRSPILTAVHRLGVLAWLLAVGFGADVAAAQPEPSDTRPLSLDDQVAGQ